MPELRFHPEIASEVKASYLWYQEQANGLGDDFLDELESSYQAISETGYPLSASNLNVLK